MSRGKYLTYTDRLKIEVLYNRGVSKKEIALTIGCCLKTVYNELRRGMYDHLNGKTWCYIKRYSADIAQQDFEWKQSAKGRPLALDHHYDFANHVRREIVEHHYSPDIITHELRKRGSFTVSTTTLYRYLDAGNIPGVSIHDLAEKRKCRSVQDHRPKRAPKGRSIELRPLSVLARASVGHWEMDSIIGKSSGRSESVIVLTERKSRLEILRKVPEKTSAATVHVLQRLDKQFSFDSITVDNGSEFQDCKGMEYKKDGSKRTEVYYCHPYCSSERGSNERMNRMIRRFLPKGMSLRRVSQARLDEIETWLNNYPRRSLGYRTPLEVYLEGIRNKNL